MRNVGKLARCCGLLLILAVNSVQAATAGCY